MRRMVAIVAASVIGVSVIYAESFNLKSEQKGKLYGQSECKNGTKKAKTLKGLVAHFITHKIPGDIVEYESNKELSRLGIVENVCFLGEKDGKEYNFEVSQFKDKASLKKALPLLKGRGGIMEQNGLFVISLQSKGPASEIVKVFKQY